MVYRVVIVGTEVDGKKGQPYDAGRVHGESNVFSFVEVLWDLSRLERVPCA